MTDETPPPIEPALRTVAMPADTNPAGDIFGGWLLAQMDLGGGLAAMREARGRVATVAIDAMSFKRPVKVGDEVTVWAELLSVGTTSLRYRVSAWRRPRDRDRHIKVTEAIFTFVALDEEGRKRVIGR
ncbi:acyl-CoA thioesterase [Elioraea sp. Yellowstone]|jgi:acyl-CoA thioesterase YciA|uniref:acyl-CoA thioesterase n=1 Tax=Elioraea sp. Yellowstone TaxID=2592070 RepID=UPI001151F8D5|nr:acyl-CoA thioesterase [Elioraea sp. Yellowstone]TQF77427.1 acyl-CoA thioesterase [Elioraea sp. Yellowstone]